METGATALWRGRFFYAAFSVTVLLMAYLAELTTPSANDISPSLLIGFLVGAVFVGIVAFQIRRKKLKPAQEKLRQVPNDSKALTDWRIGTIFPMALAEWIGILGLLLRILGGNRGVSWLFFLASLVLLAMWRPRMDVGAQNYATPSVQ